MDRNKILTRTTLVPQGVHIREAKEGESESRVITGYAILFNTRSVAMYEDDEEAIYEEIAPEAVTRELLDRCDVKMTMFHDRQLLLARSINGEGSLSYDVDEKGVSFSFEAPRTVDGDKALELVRRGIINGCSFAFRCSYYDEAAVTRSVAHEDDKTVVTYTVRTILSINDFTLAADPAYPDTSCEVREVEEQRKPKTINHTDDRWKAQVREMREAIKKKY